MRDYFTIGSAPCEEPCASVGEPDYYERARDECARFIELIRKVLGPEPPGARLATKEFPHDFGMYREVVCHFDDSYEEARHYASRCEGEAPATWDAQAKPPPQHSGEALQCCDCNLVTIARDSSVREVLCDCCGRKLWRANGS